MKSVFIIIALVGTLSLSAQTKESKAKDTLSVPEGTRVVKMGKQAYYLKQVVPGVFSLDFTPESYNALIDLLSVFSNRDAVTAEDLKRFLNEQLKAQGILK